MKNFPNIRQFRGPRTTFNALLLKEQTKSTPVGSHKTSSQMNITLLGQILNFLAQEMVCRSILL